MYSTGAPARLNGLIAIEQENTHFVEGESCLAIANDDLLKIGLAWIDFCIAATERKLEPGIWIALVDVCDRKGRNVVRKFVQHWSIGHAAHGDNFGDEDVGRVVVDIIQRFQSAWAGQGHAGNRYPESEKQDCRAAQQPAERLAALLRYENARSWVLCDQDTDFTRNGGTSCASSVLIPEDMSLVSP